MTDFFDRLQHIWAEILTVFSENTPLVLLSIGLVLFTFYRMTALMMYFQQEEYDGPRYLQWIKNNGAWDRQASWLLSGALLLSFAGLWFENAYTADGPYYVAFLALVMGSLRTKFVLVSNKKPLVRTDRVKRITRVSSLLILITVIGVFWLSSLMPTSYNFMRDSDSFWGITVTTFTMGTPVWLVASLLILQALPAFLVLANKLLEPAEERIRAKFLQEAKDKFAALDPTVIAITGSFGKTSTKHILQHILSSVHPTLATPGSVNTEMGITRVIREQLSEDHSYFIVEMGAYGPGSIARLCRLTPPDVSLVTAVGPAHYERFKTLETVARAKFEIAAAATAKQRRGEGKHKGAVVVNSDGIPGDLLQQAMADVEANYIKAGQGSDLYAASIDQKADGLHLVLREAGEDHPLFVPLYGPHQVENIVSAVAVARTLGLPYSIIRASLKSLIQIRHRTEVDTTGPVATVNDAYNSNPIGFEGALDALNAVVKPGGRRIVVTPGMVELGAKHEAEHYRLGQLVPTCTDIILVVTPQRIPSFVQAIKDVAGPDVTLIEFQTQAAAEDWVAHNVRAGDAVLYENNLPDLYESPPRF